MTTFLTCVYIACFQCAAWPAILRVRQRQSSADLSAGREYLLLLGVTCQLVVMLETGADWRVWISPILSGFSVSVLLGTIRFYRRVKGG